MEVTSASDVTHQRLRATCGSRSALHRAWPALDRITLRWRQFWLSRGGARSLGRLATRLGSLGVGPYRCRYPLAWVQPRQGYIDPSAEIIGVDLRRGIGVF